MGRSNHSSPSEEPPRSRISALLVRIWTTSLRTLSTNQGFLRSNIQGFDLRVESHIGIEVSGECFDQTAAVNAERRTEPLGETPEFDSPQLDTIW